jgi:hypothetical protein
MIRITDQAIDQLHAEYHGAYGGVRNDYFARLFLMQEHDLQLDRALIQTTFGGRDYGFDAFHFDRQNHNLYLYQFKWSEDPGSFKESYRRMLDAGLDRIFVGSAQDQKQNQAVLQIKSCLLENKRIIEAVFIRFVFRGDPSEAENSKVLGKLQEDLEGKKYLVDQYFSRSANFVIDYRSSRGHVAGISAATKTHRYAIDLEDPVQKAGPDGQVLHIASVKLFQLNRMFEEMGQRFLDRNIRSGLTGDEAPNRAITKALRDIVLDEKVDPAVFLFNHNGVTLYAQHVRPNGGTFEITEPRILNGAQTVTTFNSFIKKYADHPKLAHNRPRLEAIEVQCRILTEAADDFVISVTVNNNRQNPVKPWALRANDMIQLELEDKFRDDLHIYYERQENAFHNLTDEDLERMEIEQQKAIELRRLAVAFLISDGEIDRAARLPEVFEDDKSYAHVFGPSRLNAHSGDILLCYKIQFRIRRLVQEIMERGFNKYSFAQRARNLIWALIYQGMRNDPSYRDQREKYGQVLSIEAGFSEWMQSIASTRVRHILSDLAGNPAYKAKLDDGRFDFLRTKAAFDFCMERTYKRWKWVHWKLRG